MHRLKTLQILPLLFIPVFLCGQTDFELVQFSSGFSRPVDIVHADDSRMFIVEQRGRIQIVDETGEKADEPFLNIIARVNSSENEQGLLGLAFHPQYAENGYFYVNYTQGDSTVIARFERDSIDADKADPNSEQRLMTIFQPFDNHNGGDLAFGPDGYLYIGLGDGGWFDDPQNNSQDPLSFLGKLLRIDVDNGDPYSIPPDNPFAEDDFTLDEIWAMGLRNPWRFSFDRHTGDLWIADVGQDQREEIDFQPANSTGGENYGWRCFEGTAPYIMNDCPSQELLTGPYFEYGHNLGCSVTGGNVYRGAKYGAFYGNYIFADFCSGRFWMLTRDTAGVVQSEVLANLSNFRYSTFGENTAGDLFVAGWNNGVIYEVQGELISAVQGVEATDEEISIYPNPCAYECTLEFDAGNLFGATYEILNIQGSLVATGVLESSSGLQTLDVRKLQSGMYFLVLRYDQIARFVRLMKL